MKIGAKEAALAALRARRVPKPAKTVTPKRSKAPAVPVQRKKSKPSVRPQKPPLSRKAVAATTDASGPPPPAKPKLGRPSTGFDRVVYQRLYCQLWRRNGKRPSKDWPAAEQATLATLKTEKPI